MKTINVALGERSSPILIEDRLLDRAGEHLSPMARDGRLLVVSDENVWQALGARLQAGLGETKAIPIIVPPGEESKCWEGLQKVVDALLGHGVERADHIIAFGGGVGGALTGFAAAIVNRGCNCVQVPTSLLAQVDSSVGGKTAINVAAEGNDMVSALNAMCEQRVDDLFQPGPGLALLTRRDDDRDSLGLAEARLKPRPERLPNILVADD